MTFALKYRNLNKPTKLRMSFSIVDQLKRKDKAAQKKYYIDHFDQLVRIPLRYTASRNEAITIVNDGFLKIFASVEKLGDESKLVQWSAAIIRNTAIDYVRKKVKYENKHTDLDSTSPIAVANNTALQSLTMEEMMKLVHSLPDTDRIVFCMYAIDGYKHSEIAKSLSISEGTSKWYLNKARKNLKSLLKQYVS